MRQLFILCIVLCTYIQSSAQIHVGLKSQLASTWLINKNVSDAGTELDYKASSGLGFGLHGIYMTGRQSGIGLGLGISNHTQQWQGKFGDEKVVFETALKYTDIGLFYTYLSEGGMYVEVGPQFSLRNKKIEQTGDLGGDNEEVRTFTDKNMNNSTLFGVLGIGGLINLNDDFKLMVGLRFGYGITDLTNELSEAEFADLDPNNTSGYTYVSQLEASTEDPEFSYQPTNPAFAGFNLGIFYTFSH